jgi:hypothetical protein
VIRVDELGIKDFFMKRLLDFLLIQLKVNYCNFAYRLIAYRLIAYRLFA